MALASICDPNFNIARVVFTPEDFMEIIRSDLPTGSFILADEIGSWMPARDYMTLANKLLSLVLQTFRYKRIGVIWTIPQNRQADINVRTMSDVIIETLKIHKKIQMVETKFKYVETDPITGDVFRKFPVVSNDAGASNTITRVFFDRPEKELEKLYLEKKEEHMESFYAQIHHQLMVDNEDENKIVKQGEIIKNLLDSGMDDRKIAEHMETSLQRVRNVKTENKMK